MRRKRKKRQEKAPPSKKTTSLPSAECNNDGWLSQVKFGWYGQFPITQLIRQVESLPSCPSSAHNRTPYFPQLISLATSGTLYWPDPNVDRIAALKPKRRHGEENMRHRAILVLLFAIATAVSGSTQQRNGHTDISGSGGQLVGTWRLISRVVRLEDGTAVQEGLGTTPKGYLMYDSSGHMAVQLLRPDRPTAIDCSSSGAAPSDNSPLLLNGYEAYFGTYTIDETNHTVTHHLEGALAAADVGRNLIRQFRVSGDKLTIVVRTSSAKERQIRTLTWERVR